MKQYDWVEDGMQERDNGDYILFTDHEAAMKQLQEECDETLIIAYMSGMSGARAAIKKAVEGEREACANTCDQLRINRPTTEKGLLIATECAAAIRARGANKEGE